MDKNNLNTLDRLVNWISPERAYKRMAFRNANEIMQKNMSYDAYGHGGYNSQWRVVNESAEWTDKWARDDIRAKARDLERNSDMMNAVISAFVRNVYGPGYTLQVKIGDGETEDYTDMNTAIEKAWKKWCKAKNCDVTGSQDFNEMMLMCVQRKKVDGGILIVKTYSGGGYLPLKLQLFEVDELDQLNINPKYKNDKVVGGVEYNAYNKAVGYWIRQYSTDGYQEIEPVYIDAKDVIFYFSKKRPSQLREMSDLTPTITRIRDINQFMESVSVKERILACLSIFITKLTPGGANFGRSANATSEHPDYSGKTISPGMMLELAPGENVQAVAPSGQTTDADAYIKLQEKMVAAGQGMSYEAVSRDMSQTNYSSARQAIIEDERTYGREQALLMTVLDEIYESFIISMWLAGEFDAPDFWENKDKYFAHTWIMPAKRWIDPTKEANANKIALASGQKTYQQLAAESGRNWKDMIDEMSEAGKYADKKGMNLGGVIFDGKEKPEEQKTDPAAASE